jgi:hypothetical protein
MNEIINERQAPPHHWLRFVTSVSVGPGCQIRKPEERRTKNEGPLTWKKPRRPSMNKIPKVPKHMHFNSSLRL